MSVNGGPNISENGLVFSLDAADKTSYPGTGTAWNDLVGNNNGTLTNGPTFSTDGKGSIVFDGVDDYVIGNLNLGISGDAEFTIAYWAYWDDNSFSSNFPSGFGGNDTNTSGQNLSTTWSSGRIALDYWNYRFRANNALNVKTWYYVVFTKVPGLNNATNTKLYANAIGLDGTTEGSDVAPNIIDSPFVVGRLDSSRWFKGRISTAQVYRRALSSQEILQNYNNTKSRFGL
jgi:hypothetical protein